MIPWPTDWFCQFWSAYPRRVAKKAAWKALEKVRRNEEVEFEVLLVAVKAFAESVRTKDREFIPHPTTWINQGRWDDELPTPQSDTSWRVSAAVEATLRRRMQ